MAFAVASSYSLRSVGGNFPHLIFATVSLLLALTQGTGAPLTHEYISNVPNYNVDSGDNEDNHPQTIFLIRSRWQAETVQPISLRSSEGMSARSHHRIRQSASELDDAGMDLPAQLRATAASQEVSTTTAAVSWTDWKLPPVIVCALVGAILFTLLFLLWLRKQMSGEKKSGDDRRGLVEEGAAGPAPADVGKNISHCMEAQWVHQPFVKMPMSVQPVRTSVPSPGLPEIMSIATPERRAEPVRVKAKGLLERRGSSASLTIELAPAPESPPHIVTPTHECTSEEFLLSAGNVLSRAQLRKVIRDPMSLHKEFWEVPLNMPERVDICGVSVKNRYSRVLPNSHSRVVLAGIDDPIASYINANYIKGYDGEDNRYIATQGPLASTVTDFWRMVWMNKAPAVVMMTRLHENSTTKCDVYFPLESNSRIQSGPFTISVTSIVSKDGYTVRDLELRQGSERRSVIHYWYDSWYDHAVPQAADTLVSLAAEVNTFPGPIIVHCSAGIGRTGCFIALATGMIQLARDGNVDILGILCQMRYDRGGMVQTAEQYEFVHKALCLYEQTLDGKPPTSGD